MTADIEPPAEPSNNNSRIVCCICRQAFDDEGTYFNHNHKDLVL